MYIHICTYIMRVTMFHVEHSADFLLGGGNQTVL
jgi:hypothetical protein